MKKRRRSKKKHNIIIMGCASSSAKLCPGMKGGGVNGEEKDGHDIHGLNTDAKDGGAGADASGNDAALGQGRAGTGTADGSAHGGRRSHRRQLSGSLSLREEDIGLEEGDELELSASELQLRQGDHDDFIDFIADEFYVKNLSSRRALFRVRALVGDGDGKQYKNYRAEPSSQLIEGNGGCNVALSLQLLGVPEDDDAVDLDVRHDRLIVTAIWIGDSVHVESTTTEDLDRIWSSRIGVHRAYRTRLILVDDDHNDSRERGSGDRASHGSDGHQIFDVDDGDGAVSMGSSSAWSGRDDDSEYDCSSPSRGSNSASASPLSSPSSPISSTSSGSNLHFQQGQQNLYVNRGYSYEWEDKGETVVICLQNLDQSSGEIVEVTLKNSVEIYEVRNGDEHALVMSVKRLFAPIVPGTLSRKNWSAMTKVRSSLHF